MAQKKQPSAGCVDTTHDDGKGVGSPVDCKTSTRESSKVRDCRNVKENDVPRKGEEKKEKSGATKNNDVPLKGEDKSPNGNVTKSKNGSNPDYALLYNFFF